MAGKRSDSAGSGEPDGGAPTGAETRGLTNAAAAAGVARIKRFRLTVTDGGDQGLVASSTGDRLVVGTHRSCDLVLHDDTVSRFHCDVAVEGDRVLLRDLDSRNGTRVDGVSVLQAHLRAGAVISIGRGQLRFDPDVDSVSLELSRESRFGLMVGGSPVMRRAFALLERAAASDATVLLLGETGTGKEVAAESIHRHSARAERPFVVVDCGAIPADLLESELFGHERGAFTGAVAAREGAFEAADGGTVFLDEIGELAPELQPKLLRVLERREVKRVGATHYAPVDVRVIVATHRDLRSEVNRKGFRADLYYRIAVLEVRLPPLRERKEDLPLLVERLLESQRVDDAAAERLSRPEFVAELSRHSWPGNVRELRNYVERCLALGEATPIEPAPIEPGGPSIDLDSPLRAAREQWLRPFERQYVEGLLARHDGNVTAAARAAGVDRITFYRLLWKYGMR